MQTMEGKGGGTTDGALGLQTRVGSWKRNSKLDSLKDPLFKTFLKSPSREQRSPFRCSPRHENDEGVDRVEYDDPAESPPRVPGQVRHEPSDADDAKQQSHNSDGHGAAPQSKTTTTTVLPQQRIAPPRIGRRHVFTERFLDGLIIKA